MLYEYVQQCCIHLGYSLYSQPECVPIGRESSIRGMSLEPRAISTRSTLYQRSQTKVEIRPAPLWMNILRQGKIKAALLTFQSQWARSSFPSPKRSSTNYAMCATNSLHPRLHPHLVHNSFRFSFAGYISH